MKKFFSFILLTLCVVSSYSQGRGYGDTIGVSNLSEKEDSDIFSLENCSMLVDIGRGNVVLKSLLQYKNVLKNVENIDALKYASVVSLLAKTYIQIGDYSSAQKEIESLNSEIGINTEILPIEYVQDFFACAGVVAYRLKDYPKALRFSHAACNLLDKIGDYGINYSKVLSNIAIIYAEAGQTKDFNYYLDAKWYIDEAISIFEERIGPLKEYGSAGITLLSNAATVYEAIGDRDEAISTLENIVKDFANNIDVRDAWALAANNLACLYMKEGKWAAGKQLLESLITNNDDMNYVFSQNLALCLMYLKENTKAAETIEKMNSISIDNISNIFSYFAGVERDDYWSQISLELICINNLVAFHTNDKLALLTAYDNTLFCKSLLLNFSILLEGFLANLKDTELLEKRNYLKNQLAFKTESVLKKDSISREITKCEKQMLETIGDFGLLLKKEIRTWQDVKASLNENEIAIEYCYAPRMEHYPDLQPYYGAFVLRKEFDYPILISLENVDSVEAVYDKVESDALMINELYSSDKAVTLYKMLWSKLSPYMEGITKVYYSPTSYLSNINFDVLHDETGEMLNEKYSMHRVSSTANINDIKASESASYHSSVLYGNIKYDENLDVMANASSVYDEYSGTEIEKELALRSESERGKWSAIPSTKKEIENIDRLLRNKGVDVVVFDSIAANEESFKKLHKHSPDILHLATHGFVIDTPLKAEGNKFVASTNIYSQKESYLMWAGLMMAGGNNVWQGKFNLSNVEDGVLTADEISRLDLSNTKLVVLSACETARGKVDPVDGIYGLQRAFKQAGVKTIVMSLWKVDDDATSMLMTQFYTYLTSGVEKHQALWNAMMDVRKKYKDPYYWAGFIMLD